VNRARDRRCVLLVLRNPGREPATAATDDEQDRSRARIRRRRRKSAVDAEIAVELERYKHGIVGHAAAEQSRLNGLPTTTRADIVAACEYQPASLNPYPAAAHVRVQAGNYPRPTAGRHAEHIVHQTG